MNLMQSICGFMEESTSNSKSERDDDIEVNIPENAKEIPRESSEQLSPRDGMSAESAKFLIGECANNKGLKVYGIENEGRYFRAKVIDRKGKVVNELLVDKLNGNVKFIR